MLGALCVCLSDGAHIGARNVPSASPACSEIEDIRFKTKVLIELRFFDADF
jgi:hypothetical protein